MSFDMSFVEFDDQEFNFTLKINKAALSYFICSLLHSNVAAANIFR